MRVTATYLYPDFSSKRKNNNFMNKKSSKNSEKSFEECLIRMNEKMDQEHTKKIRIRNFG